MDQNTINPIELRKFGFVLAGGLFILFFLFPLLRHFQFNFLPLFICGTIAAIAEYRRDWLKKLYRPWMKVGHILGWINTRFILGFVFFLLITPIGLIRRCCGKDALQRTYDPKLTTYRKPSIQQTAKQMEKPY
jgi:hypothetical protein